MSFAADMKDFVTAAQAGQKMAGAKDDADYKRALTEQAKANTETVNQKNNDEEGQAADLAMKQAGVRLRNAQIGLTGERLSASQELRAQQRAAIAAMPPPPQSMTQSIAGAPPVGRPAPVEVGAAPPQAVPVDPAPDQAAGYSAGGSVQKFADGGAVADDSDDPDDEASPAAVAPAVGTAPAEDAGTSDTTDISARSRGFSGQAGLDGVKAGLTYGAKALGLHTPGSAVGGPSPGRQRAAQAWATGQHAAPPEDMDKIKKWIDPDNKMGESEQNLAAIGAVYQFKMKHNDPEGAAKAAFQMLQYHRQASQRYAAIAAHAADNGDLDTATHAAMKAYANVPDDKDVKFAKTPDGKVSYTYTDSATGKVLSQGIESADKLASAAMGFAEKGFDESLMAAIQMRPAVQPKPAVDPDTVPMKAPDKKAALAQIDAAYDEQNPDDEKTKAPKYNAEDKMLFKGAAFRVATNSKNTRLTPAEAMDVTAKIADPTLTNEKNGFSTKKVDGGYQVTIGKRPPVHIPAADFDALMEKRSAAIEARKKAAADSEKPGLGASIAGAADSAITGVKGYLAKNKAKAEAELAARDAKAKATPAAAPALTDYTPTM